MREVSLNRYDGGVDTFKCFEYSEFPWLNMPDKTIKSRHHKYSYLKLFSTFDIETTTIDNGVDTPYGFMYHWQMDIGGVIAYGRTWKEWTSLLNRIVDWLNISEDKRLVIYVHNLGYEFQFMRDFLNSEFGGFEVFAAQKRKPIKVICGNGIEFRCSLKLTNMSLAKAVDNELGTVHPKASGDLDYKICRTPTTELDDTEFGYCIADVVSLYELIQCKMKNESDDLESIPLTSTGYVRRDCRNATRKERNYRDMFMKNTMTDKVYMLLKEAGRGGNTHANRYMSGRVWHGVDSYDVASSYPYQMLVREYPMKSFYYYGELETYEEFLGLLDEYACLFRIVFDDLQVRPTTTMPYIASSKAIGQGTNLRFDNGRVLSADTLALTINDIDFKIIKEQYTWNEIAIADMYITSYGMLPESLRGQVLNYFNQKTELKDKIKHSEGEEKANNEYLYAKSKNRLNGIFGMCYTDPVRSTIAIDKDTKEWIEEPANIAESLAKYYNSKNSFLIYAWGVWVTSWARKHLQDLLDATGAETIYCDTDSSKAIIHDKKKIDRLNKKIMLECDDKGAYCDYNDTRYYLGVYEHENEEPIKAFKTLGAKKYVYDDGELHVTISGVKKKEGAKELKEIENFTPGFIFKEAGGNTLYYNDCDIHTININGEEIVTASNIGMIDSTYEIGITQQYAELIGFNILED